MNTRLTRRVAKLEGQLRAVPLNPVESADQRLQRAVLCTLSPEELEVLIDHAKQLQDDPSAKPSPAQAAALEVYEQRYREFKSTGKLVVDGWPVEV
jgi:hypothetical protein